MIDLALPSRIIQSHPLEIVYSSSLISSEEATVGGLIRWPMYLAAFKDFHVISACSSLFFSFNCIEVTQPSILCLFDYFTGWCYTCVTLRTTTFFYLQQQLLLQIILVPLLAVYLEDRRCLSNG